MILLAIVLESLTLNKFESYISGFQRLICYIGVRFNLCNINFWVYMDNSCTNSKNFQSEILYNSTWYKVAGFGYLLRKNMGLGDAVSDISETDKQMIRLKLNICIDVHVLSFRVSNYAFVIVFRCVYCFRNTTILKKVVTTQPSCGSSLVRKI